MRILQRVPDSCLWLLADNPAAEANLRQYARDHNVDPARLVFAGRVDYIDFLARFGVADLFLETVPCTGGTTINDALWMDLPIVTRPGRSFASRLSGSILSALGLSNYITDSVATYEELAVRLAQQPSLLQAYRQELQANKTTQALFDMPRLVHHIEDALEQLVRSSPQPQNQASEAAPGTPEPQRVTRISVILTTHNDADWIEHVMHSIHKETGDDVQLIVVCDMHNSAIQQRVGALLRGQDLYLQRCAMPGLEASRTLGQQLAGSTPTMILHEGGALTPEFLTALRPS